MKDYEELYIIKFKFPKLHSDISLRIFEILVQIYMVFVCSVGANYGTLQDTFLFARTSRLALVSSQIPTKWVQVFFPGGKSAGV